MKERPAGSGTGRNRDIGLPATLSVAGLLVAVIIAGSAGLETWLSSGPQPAPVTSVAIVEPEPAANLYQAREVTNLRSTVNTLEIKVEQLMATNERLERQFDDLVTQMTQVTASVPSRGTPDIDYGVAGDRKSDRESVHFPARRSQSRPLPPPTGKTLDETSAQNASPMAGRPTQTYFALQLPTFRSVKELTGAWNGIKRRSGKVLAGLEPRAFAVRDPLVGAAYRLLAGPIRNAGDAALRCVRLGEIGIPCESTVFAGEPLVSTAAN